MNFESHNPATGELLGSYPEHNKAEIEVRLQRAWDGWRHWSRTPLHERIAFLTRLAELLEERAETYGRLITAEMGKPLADSIFEIKRPPGMPAISPKQGRLISSLSPSPAYRRRSSMSR
jgi:acyl-CoA reductase-like NAD-dependent aldehyde dehydrogenase